MFFLVSWKDLTQSHDDFGSRYRLDNSDPDPQNHRWVPQKIAQAWDIHEAFKRLHDLERYAERIVTHKGPRAKKEWSITPWLLDEERVKAHIKFESEVKDDEGANKKLYSLRYLKIFKFFKESFLINLFS